MSAPLSDADHIEISRVLLACGPYLLWERWLCAQPPAVAQLLRQHARTCAAQSRAEAQAAAAAADRRVDINRRMAPSPMRPMPRN